ncbi:MAG: hypothetical protein ACP5OG_02650 [Candidatus Nanoarchaeia archaeon]
MEKNNIPDKKYTPDGLFVISDKSLEEHIKYETIARNSGLTRFEVEDTANQISRENPNLGYFFREIIKSDVLNEFKNGFVSGLITFYKIFALQGKNNLK